MSKLNFEYSQMPPGLVENIPEVQKNERVPGMTSREPEGVKFPRNIPSKSASDDETSCARRHTLTQAFRKDGRF